MFVYPGVSMKRLPIVICVLALFCLFYSFSEAKLTPSEQALTIWNRIVGRKTLNSAPKTALKYRGIERQSCGKECAVRYGSQQESAEKKDGKVRIQRMEQQNGSVKLKAYGLSIVLLIIIGFLLF